MSEKCRRKEKRERGGGEVSRVACIWLSNFSSKWMPCDVETGLLEEYNSFVQMS